MRVAYIWAAVTLSTVFFFINPPLISVYELKQLYVIIITGSTLYTFYSLAFEQ